MLEPELLDPAWLSSSRLAGSLKMSLGYFLCAPTDLCPPMYTPRGGLPLCSMPGVPLTSAFLFGQWELGKTVTSACLSFLAVDLQNSCTLLLLSHSPIHSPHIFWLGGTPVSAGLLTDTAHFKKSHQADLFIFILMKVLTHGVRKRDVIRVNKRGNRIWFHSPSVFKEGPALGVVLFCVPDRGFCLES